MLPAHSELTRITLKTLRAAATLTCTFLASPGSPAETNMAAYCRASGMHESYGLEGTGLETAADCMACCAHTWMAAVSLSLKSELFRALVSACMRRKGVLSCIGPFNGRTNQNGSEQLRIVSVTFRCSAGSRVTDAMLHAQAFKAVLIQ